MNFKIIIDAVALYYIIFFSQTYEIYLCSGIEQ